MSAVFFNYRRRTSHVSQGEVVWESKKKNTTAIGYFTKRTPKEK
jgi:hypothetical protein